MLRMPAPPNRGTMPPRRHKSSSLHGNWTRIPSIKPSFDLLVVALCLLLFLTICKRRSFCKRHSHCHNPLPQSQGRMDRRGSLPRRRHAVASYLSFIFVVLLLAGVEGFRFPFPTARTASR